jgi:anti-anti-sigma regulatory factor/HAMP domain-containing protein
MQRGTLRARLLGIVSLGIIGIAAVAALVGSWGLGRMRDLAIDDSRRSLEQQAGDYLQKLAQARASALGQNLDASQQLASATRDYLSQVTTFQVVAKPMVFKKARDGRRYIPGVTTTLLPPGDDDQAMADKLVDSQSLEILLPGLARQLPGIARVSYLSTFGALRTYPALSPSDLPANWTVQSDAAYQAGAQNALRTMLWSNIHPGLGPGGQVVSAVAPIYQRGEFIGSIVVDINLSYLTGYLQRIKVEQTGFGFLVDGQGHLIAASEDGQRVLLGRAMPAREQGALVLDLVRPSLTPSLGDMLWGGSSAAQIDRRGRRYLVAYTPIANLGWSLAVAAPLEEITASTGVMAERVAGVTQETNRLGLLASSVAVVVLGLLLSIVLQRQIIRPVTLLASATNAVAAGDLRPIVLAGAGEIGQLVQSFNTMTASLAASRAESAAAHEQLEDKVQERTADLDRAVANLEAAHVTQQQLLQALREVSTPVIPVIDGVLAMPLIGQIDQERAQNMVGALLARIERDRAHTVLLDITGVPMIDTHVAQSLLHMVYASRLLGAKVVLVGVSPEVAQTIVTLGIDLRNLGTAADLRSAVEGLLTRRKAFQPAISF